MAHDPNSSNDSYDAGSTNKLKREKMRQVLNQIKVGMLATEGKRLAKSNGTTLRGSLWFCEKMEILWSVHRVYGVSKENMIIELVSFLFNDDGNGSYETYRARRRVTPTELVREYRYFGSIKDTTWG